MLPEHTIVCLPVRSTLDASLQGFEVCPRVRTPAGAGPLTELQIRYLLGASMAQRIRARDTHLWLRLPGEMLAIPGDVAWIRQAVVRGGWCPASLTLAIAPRDAGDDPASVARGLRVLGSRQARVALADVELSDVDVWAHHLGDGPVDELRLSGSCTDPARTTALSAAVRAWRRHRVSLTGLDIRTLEQCDVAISCGLDLIQGRIAGLTFPLERLDGVLTEMAPTGLASRGWRAPHDAA